MRRWSVVSWRAAGALPKDCHGATLAAAYKRAHGGRFPHRVAVGPAVGQAAYSLAEIRAAIREVRRYWPRRSPAPALLAIREPGCPPMPTVPPPVQGVGDGLATRVRAAAALLAAAADLLSDRRGAA